MIQSNNVGLFQIRLQSVMANLTSLMGEKEFGNSAVISRILSIIDSFNSNLNSNKGLISVNSPDVITDEGKIRVALATSNGFKKKDFESYFDVNHFGSAIKELFHIETFDVVVGTDENVYSFKENAQGKALANTIPNAFVIGDDSGIILPEMSTLLNEIRNVIFEEGNNPVDPRNNTEQEFVDNALLPGAVSKRFSTDEVIDGIIKLCGSADDSELVREQLLGWKDRVSDERPISVSTQNIFTIAAFADMINLLSPVEEFGIIDEHISDHTAILQSTLCGLITDENGYPVFSHDVTSGIRGILRLPKLPRHIQADVNLLDDYFKNSHAYNSVFWMPDHDKFLCDMSEADRSQVDHRGDAFGDILAQLLCSLVNFNFTPFMEKVQERIEFDKPQLPVVTTLEELMNHCEYLVVHSVGISIHPQDRDESETDISFDYDDGDYYKAFPLNTPVTVDEDGLVLMLDVLYVPVITSRPKLAQSPTSSNEEQTLTTNANTITTEQLLLKVDTFVHHHNGTSYYPQYNEETGLYDLK